MSRGICKLTGKAGKFVKSHLIPKALTRPSVPGNQFVEFGLGRRPYKRRTSWYDERLVTRDGEDLLAEYDSWGIEELYRLKLVWGSWGPMMKLGTNDQVPLGTTGHTLRKLTCRDPRRFRLFFLSLLWRAAATDCPGFEDIQIEATELEKLRQMLCDRDPGPLHFYPTQLAQISTRGPNHNFAPIARDEKSDIGGEGPYHHYVFRFYFDGLIANMQRDMPKAAEAGPLLVGFSPILVVQTLPFADSFQFTNLLKAWAESVLQWPETMEKKYGFPVSERENLLRTYVSQHGDGWWIKRKELPKTPH